MTQRDHWFSDETAEREWPEPGPPTGELAERISALEGRVMRVEGALLARGMLPRAEAGDVGAGEGFAGGIVVERATQRGRAEAASVRPAENPPSEPIEAVPPPLPAVAVAAPDRRTWEEMIGKNWASWVGAIVVVLGVFFFLKYAWDQGWLVLSPAARVWVAIAAGVVSAGVGLVLGSDRAPLWVAAKRGGSMRVLSGTLMGLGVAVGMSACFAAHVMFEPAVFSRGGATLGVVLCAAAGIALAVHANVMSVAIIALLGAYLGPMIL